MTQQIPCSNPKFNKTINPEQFNEIAEAILDGKYSWACVLLLRSTGHNPLDYIPDRTYSRLLKENRQVGSSKQRKTDTLKIVSKNAATKSDSQASQKRSSKIVDLNYLEPVGEKNVRVRGGSLEPGYFNGNREDYLLENPVFTVSNW